MTVIRTPADRLHYMNELLDGLLLDVARKRDDYADHGQITLAVRLEEWVRKISQLQVHVGLLTAELEDAPRA